MPPVTVPPTTTTTTTTTTTVVTVVPDGDAWVRNGSTSKTNYGTATTLEVKTDSVYGFTREAYLTFPIPGASDPARAVLRLTGKLQKGSLGLAAHQVATAPVESTVTWDRRPAFGTEVARRTVTGTASQVIELDVTAAVLAARRAGSTTVTIGLRATTSGEPLLGVSSREAGGDVRPLLVLQAR
jgi:hypothetical protein